MTGCPVARRSPITSLHRSKGGSVGGGDGKEAGGADAASELLSDNKSLTELEPPNDTGHVSGSGRAQALMGAVSSTMGSKLGRKTLNTQSEGNGSSAHSGAARGGARNNHASHTQNNSTRPCQCTSCQPGLEGLSIGYTVTGPA